MAQLSSIELEQLALNAWPSIQTYLHQGMIARWADGYTKRANSATVLFDSDWSIDKQKWVEDFYAAREQRPIFRLLSFNQPDLFDQQLEADGYTRLDPTAVMTRAIDSAPDGRPMAVQCQILPLSDWLEIYHQLERSKLGEEKQRLHKAILERIPGKICPMVLTGEHEAVSCGLGVLDGGALGLFDIATGENHRRKGYGTALIENLIAWGGTQGGKLAYLQVIKKNEAAISLYVKKGFKLTYSYWYRAKAR